MPTSSPQGSALGAAGYDEIFASSAVGVAVWRDDGLIEHANQTLADLVGAAHAEELKGIGLSSCFSEMYQARISESLSRAIRAQSSSVVEAEVPHGCENRLLLVTNIGSSTYVGGISLFIDLTASLTALALASAPADTTASVHRLNAALAHEINNPLAYAMGNLSFAIETLQTLVDRAPDLGTVVLALRDALEGAERVRRTVRELRLSSRRASGAPASNSDTGSALSAPGQQATSDRPEHSSGARMSTAARAGKTGQNPARCARVLVVDDEPRIGSAIARILVPKHDVCAVYTARDAMLRLQSGERFDVILCDVMLPEMSGGELYQAILTKLPELAARVVFMTGGPFSAPGARVLDTAPNERLEKPFSPEALRSLIERMMATGE